MKNGVQFLAHPVLILGVCIMIIVSCKKDDDPAVDAHSGQVTDIDGNVYKTVKIGSQIWMAENLKTTRYSDGAEIPNVTENDVWAGLNTDAFTWYSNSSNTYGESYGALYNWYAVGKGNLCPTGWHVPTDGEWKTLTDFLGGELVSGGKLKEATTDYWLSPNTGATNETGFSALPGGFRENGSFIFIRKYGYYWTSSDGSASGTWTREMNFEHGEVKRFSRAKKSGLSVRCIKNN